LTAADRRARINLARRGLENLRKFDRATMTDADRLSADLMEWQLDTVVREEPYLGYMFPLEQMNGANVRLIETLTVRHPLLTEKDAAGGETLIRERIAGTIVNIQSMSAHGGQIVLRRLVQSATTPSRRCVKHCGRPKPAA